MLKPAIPGKPAVNRFKKGCMYLIKWSDKRFQMLLFKWISKDFSSYVFHVLADQHKSLKGPFTTTIPKEVIVKCQVCQIYRKDLPLYINSNTYPKFNQILSGENPKESVLTFRGTRPAKRQRYKSSRKKNV